MQTQRETPAVFSLQNSTSFSGNKTVTLYSKTGGDFLVDTEIDVQATICLLHYHPLTYESKIG